ncbi:MAG: S8 family serine peptidase [Omnitrophica bacterium]|nr:S8 family serine peptidase [Candidatus Omnitrophota bacterium]
MKTKSIVRIGAILCFLVFVAVFSSGNPAYGLLDESRSRQRNLLEADHPYAPGEVLVKFKEGVDPQVALEKGKVRAQSIQRAYSVKPEIAKFKKDYALERDQNGWYWFRGKNYKESADISDEEFFQEVYAEMSPEKKSLYRTYKIILPENMNVKDAVIRLQHEPSVEYAEPNYIAKAFAVPNDPYYNSNGSWGQSYDDLWGLKKIRCQAAWNVSQGEGVVVAVIDSGVDYNHEDFFKDENGNGRLDEGEQYNIWINEGEIPGNGIDDDANGYVDDIYGYDFVYGDPDPSDFFGHGTHCAGTIAAVGNNNLGVIGVAPKAKIMVLKGLSDDRGSGNNDTLVNCIKYAADNGAHIISNSWGGPSAQAYKDVFAYAQSQGCLSIAAAGNSGGDEIFYPAGLSTVMAVSASDHNDQICLFSTYGEHIEVSAPGGGIQDEFGGGRDDLYNILSTMSDNSKLAKSHPKLKISNGYWRMAGTSMACPHVAGVAALARSIFPGLTNEEIRQKIQAASNDIGEAGKDIYFGYGRVDAYGTLLTFVIDITSPQHQSYIRGNVDVFGNAFVGDGKFQSYELYCASKDNSGEEPPVLIISSNNPVQDGFLTLPDKPWDTTQCSEGSNILTLKVITTDGVELTSFIGVIIDNENQPPEFINLRDKQVAVDEIIRFKVEAQDPDDPKHPLGWGELVYSADSLPEGAEFNPQTQIFFWRPGELGVYEVSFKVSDSAYTIARTIAITTHVMQKMRITTELSYKDSAHIYMDKIVWMDDRNNGQPDIYLYDLSTGREIQVTDSSYAELDPFVYEDKILWWDGSSEMYAEYPYINYDIFMRTYDSLTGKLGPIIQVTTDPHAQSVPKMYKDKILWTDNRNGMLDVYLRTYDSSTGELGPEVAITSDPDYYQYQASMYEDTIVWADERVGQLYYFGIYMRTYDSSTGELGPEIGVCTNPSMQIGPLINRDRIVWLDWRNGGIQNPDIYMRGYDSSTGELGPEMPLVTNPSKQVCGRIYENNVLWVDDRFADGLPFAAYDFDIYMYNLSTDQEIRITDETGYQYGPSMYHNRIVWSGYDLEDKGYAIYMLSIFLSPQITSLSPTTVSIGSTITITGNNFGYTVERAGVKFANGVHALIDSWSNDEITCRVPEGAQSGLLKVITRGGESEGVQITVGVPSGLPGDVNGDGKVDILDLNIVARAFGSSKGDPGWDARADLDISGTVGIGDLIIVARNFGKVAG